MQNRPAARPGSRRKLRAASGLTRREIEVMSWVREGKRNGEIAVILGISPHTVRKHLENTFSKLGVETRTAAAKVFIEQRARRPAAKLAER